MCRHGQHEMQGTFSLQVNPKMKNPPLAQQLKLEDHTKSPKHPRPADTPAEARRGPRPEKQSPPKVSPPKELTLTGSSAFCFLVSLGCFGMFGHVLACVRLSGPLGVGSHLHRLGETKASGEGRGRNPPRTQGFAGFSLSDSTALWCSGCGAASASLVPES